MIHLISKLKTANGRFSSRRCQMSWMEINTPGLYDWMTEMTKDFPDEYTIADRLAVLETGSTTAPVCPVCQTMLRPGREYCSSRCSMSIRAKTMWTPELKKQADVKRRRTMLEKYGCETNSQREEIKPLLGQSQKSEESRIANRLRGLSRDCHFDREKYTVDWMVEQNQTRTCPDIAKEVGCSVSLVQQYILRSGNDIVCHSPPLGPSSVEKKVCEWLDSIGVEYKKNDRTILRPKEIDVWIPEKNLGIEVNGVYWHSDKFAHRKQHLEKTEAVESVGGQLLHFWDLEIENRFEIIQSMVLSKLGLTDRLFARDLKVVENPRRADVDEFFNSNHMQGSTSYKNCVALMTQDDEIVSALSYMKPRFDRKYENEIVRFSTKLGTTVVGGFSRLLSRVQGTVMSYANRRWSTGGVYLAAGMKHIRNTEPGLCFTDGARFFSRQSQQGKKDENLMRLWDSGNKVFARY